MTKAAFSRKLIAITRGAWWTTVHGVARVEHN